MVLVFGLLPLSKFPLPFINILVSQLLSATRVVQSWEQKSLVLFSNLIHKCLNFDRISKIFHCI